MTDELVLVIPATALSKFSGFRPVSGDELSVFLDPGLQQFRPRGEVETDPTWLQIIPYMLLTCGNEVFHYRRGGSGSEARLRSKRSIGIGGHINPCDGIGTDAYQAGRRRELEEEVLIPTGFTEEALGLIHDPSTPVGEVHLGVIHRLRLERPEVEPRESAIANPGFASIAELFEQRAEFETWSQFSLDLLASAMSM